MKDTIDPHLNDTVEPGQRTGQMRSTWYRRPLQSISEVLINFVQPHNVPQPGPRSGKLPVFTGIQQLQWALPRALPFFIVHWALLRIGLTVHPAMMTIAGGIWLLCFAFTTVRLFISFGLKWGFYDGKAPRDKVPDSKVAHLSMVYGLVAFVRMSIGVVLLYDREEPALLRPWWLLTAFVYTILLDFFFYIYHRSSHEIDWLWKIHSTHHLTKHPSPVLALLADEEQELIEVLLVPLAATWLTMALIPLQITFHDWFLIQQVILFGEVLGHSGVRAHVEAALTAPLLRPFGAELALEDHDL